MKEQLLSPHRDFTGSRLRKAAPAEDRQTSGAREAGAAALSAAPPRWLVARPCLGRPLSQGLWVQTDSYCDRDHGDRIGQFGDRGRCSCLFRPQIFPHLIGVSEFSPLPPWRGLPPDAWVSEGFGKERYLLRQDFLLVPLDKYGNDIDKLLLCQTILLDLHDFSCICKFVGFICGR